MTWSTTTVTGMEGAWNTWPLLPVTLHVLTCSRCTEREVSVATLGTSGWILREVSH